jgi:hypothetical protein
VDGVTPRAPYPRERTSWAGRAAPAALAALFLGCKTEAPPRAAAPPAPSSAPRAASLTWWFSPPLGDPDSEAGPEREIVVLFSAGAEVRRIALGRRQGALVPADQSVCRPDAKTGDVVSSVTLETMGVTHLLARRVAPGAIEISFTVEADDEPAKTHGTLARIAVPPGLAVVDHVLVARDNGTQRVLDCSAPSPE